MKQTIAIDIGSWPAPLNSRRPALGVRFRAGRFRITLDSPSLRKESQGMDFQELIRVRRSIRGYKPEPIDEDVLHRVLGAARVAPTAANLQPFDLILVRDAETRSRMKTVYAREWFYDAPAIVVGCVDPAKAWTRSDGFCAAEMDLAIVMDHLVLAAADEGLGTCWVLSFDEAQARVVLGIPPSVRVLAMTPLGYPDAEPRPFARKRIEDFLHHERW